MVRRILVLSALFTLSIGLAVLPAMGEGPPGVLGRVLATERAAVELSPSLAAARAGVGARAAETQASAAAGTPYVELQQEGVGSGFGWKSNAQTTLRLGTPFNLPSHGRARRELRDAAGLWSSAAQGAAILESAGAVGERWLELAALEESLALTRRRLDRMERALALQRIRLDLGEVAGTDVTQIELAWAGAMSTVQRLEAERLVAEEELRRYCASRCALPRAGDLEDLVRLTSTPAAGVEPAALVDGSPLWKSYELEAGVAARDARVREAAAWGRPEAEIEWEHVPALEGMPSYDAFGLRFRFPLPTGSAGGKAREAARARAVEADAMMRTQRGRIVARLQSALGVARSSESALDRLQPVLLKVDTAEASLAEQFRLGAISYLVYVDGVSRFDDVVLQAVAARRSLLAARLELAVLTADARCFPIPELPAGEGSEDEESER